MRRPRPRTLRSWCALRRFENAIEPAVQWLALAWVIVVVLELVRGGSPALEIAGTTLWAFFFLDLLVRFVLAPQKVVFLRRNWLTVIATIVPALRLARTVRALRLLRVMRWSRLVRIAGTVNRSANALRATIARRRIAYAVGVTIVVWIVGSAGIFAFERGTLDSGFDDIGTSLWWTAMMLATMGTDRWPVSVEGRLLSFLLAVYGFAVFGYITAALATLFIAKIPERASAEDSGRAR